MNNLIIHSHPNHKSFCSAITTTISEELKKNNQPYNLRDLYKMNFNPTLNLGDFKAMSKGTCSDDVRAEREFVEGADMLIFVFPVLMMNLPAILKGYIERVLSLGFGFTIKNDRPAPLLEGTKALLFTTLQGSEELSMETDLIQALDVVSDYVLKLCGIEVLEHKYFYSVPSVSHNEREAMLEEVKRITNQCLT